MHCEAIQINPNWDEQDRARAREMLIHRLAYRGKIDVSIVRQRVTFDERIDFGVQRLLVASVDSFAPLRYGVRL